MNEVDPCILFGKKLKQLRQEVSISQEKLAELADLDRTYISSIERGKRNISIRNIFKLASALNIPAQEFLNFTTILKKD